MKAQRRLTLHDRMLFEKGFIRYIVTSKNERKRLLSVKDAATSSTDNRQKANCSINMIPYAANPFKHCGNRRERSEKSFCKTLDFWCYVSYNEFRCYESEVNFSSAG